ACVCPVNEVTPVIRDEDVDVHVRAGQQLRDPVPQFLNAGAGARRDDDGPRLGGTQPGDSGRFGEVGLIQHHELGDVLGSWDIAQDVSHRADLALGVIVGGIDDVEDEVSGGDLFERGAERL